MEKKRYAVLDAIRGFALLNMILYHCIWDLVYMFDFDWNWYQSKGAYVWQQCVCWTFIFLSGFCYSLGHRKLKRGLIIYLFGFILSMVTLILMPESSIQFGILTLLGSCMLLLIPMEQFLMKIKPVFGIIISLSLFVLTRNINQGFLGFENFNLAAIPDSLYCNLFTTYLGFPSADFTSTDYFSLIPWFFLYICGFYIYHFCKDAALLSKLELCKAKPLIWLGQHSLGIYVVHQPLLYLMLILLF